MILFFDFFPFDSLGAVPENPGTVIRGVRLSVGPIYRGTTVSCVLLTKLDALTLAMSGIFKTSVYPKMSDLN